MAGPNVLVIMTDEERYAPPYETDAVRSFRRNQLQARESVREGGLEFHRHYAGSTACVPSRTTFFTGQYPSLHGVSQTSGMAKQAIDPGMPWPDPNSVPTLGDWFRAGGYKTYYRGKWHVSHADLPIPGTTEWLKASDENGNLIPEAVEAYRRADRLDPFGFSGWIGREPHGADKADCGTVRDGVFAEQVVQLFSELAGARADGPWLAVASFVNPHDIAMSGMFWDNVLGFGPPDDTVPEIPEPPSQDDPLTGRPPCQRQFKDVWPHMLYRQPVDLAYRRLYYYLHKIVDQAIARILDALRAQGFAEDTIVVFTSDHGDLVGAHGGLPQKWYNAYEEAIHVPLLIKGPGVAANSAGITVPTSHIDVIPTLLGLAGIDIERAAAGVAVHHDEAQPLPGRDLSDIISGSAPDESVTEPLYFMTEDDITRGMTQKNVLTGEPYSAVPFPSRIETVIASLPTGDDGAEQLWKLNHYYERLDDWHADNGVAPPLGAAPAAEPLFEMHNLTVDPGERHNHADDAPDTLSRLKSVLESQRDAKRLLPKHRNPPNGFAARLAQLRAAQPTVPAG